MLAFGLVLILEGLVYVLAPSLVEHLLAALRDMPHETRRKLGAVSAVLGLVLVYCAKVLGA
nr:DUF2065 domain-containing protein [Lentibacter algarum]